MSSTELENSIGTTLRDVARDASAPAIDEVAFQGLVRHHRRRQRARRVGLAAAVAAAVAVPVAGLPVVRDLVDEEPARDSGQGLAGAPGPKAAAELGTVAFTRNGTIHLQAPDKYGAGAVDTGLAAEEIVGVNYDGVVYVDRESRVRTLPFDSDRPYEPIDDVPVQWVDGTADGSLAWIGLDDGFHVRPVDGTPVDTTVTDPDQRVYDVDGDRWLLGEGDRLSVVGGKGGDVLLDVDDMTTDADLAGDRVAVRDTYGTIFADASSGEALTGAVGGTVGALSPDGRWWVGNPNPEEDADGLVRGLWVWDTTTGKAKEFADFDDTGAVVDVLWQGESALVVVETYADDAVLRTLYSCDVAALTCDYHYEDESGTLALPRG